MKLKKQILLLSLIMLLLTPAFTAQKKNWWQVDFSMTVTGNYHYTPAKSTYNGVYSFLITRQGSMELDISDDYILYPGPQNVSVLKWKEMNYDEEGNYKEVDLIEKIKPSLLINYALALGGKLKFDFEVIFAPTSEAGSVPLQNIILPRSALNKAIHPDDKYNKNVVTGSNGIKLPEKYVNKKEAQKSFKWQWEK
ncbi:MAG: hypothetical protein GY757_22585, partial [bacterium]|nr:hypothetical protein [bacterium]